MFIQKVFRKVREVLLCCRKHKTKGSLDIGHPTDVRRVDVSDALPGLTDAERKYIREKASSDAIHLLGLQSHPPSLPATSPPSPTDSRSSLGPLSGLSSREPSEALLNAASKDLPSTLPTPPRQKHNESSPPAARMRSMWTAPRISSDSSRHTRDELLEKPGKVTDSSKDKKDDPNESFMTLNLEFEFDDKNEKYLPETPRTLSFDTEGFETQSTIGGRSEANSPVAVKSNPFEQGPTIRRATRATELDDSSDSEAEIFLNTDRAQMVKM